MHHASAIHREPPVAFAVHDRFTGDGRGLPAVISLTSYGVVVSASLFAWQTGLLANQASMSNRIAATSVMYDCLERLHHVDELLAQYPDASRHFYPDSALPAAEGLEPEGIQAPARTPPIPVTTDSWSRS
ncbi:hypothetical protein [Streptomyces sp. MK5]|uniref:hypothetical protein n=1 Tax=Streptomyces sp. MK5 TaxID=3064253 RepID=UPI0027415404|nr:hypothetical protein [Streptomyces sp. MK5]